jgi:type II secretory ATPase GspE/PulE/Tfp pilus assembly ATPase PilB-like protein
MNKSVEDLLARAALIDSSGIERALEIQSKSGGSLSKILADLGLPEVLPQPTGLLPMDFCRERSVVPLNLKGNSLRLAMVNPLDYPTIQDVTFRTGKEVIAVAASESAVLSLLGQSQSDTIESQNIYEMLTSAKPEGEIVSQEETDEDIDAAKLAKDTKLAPVIRLVNLILSRAAKDGASDIHIEPKEKYLLVRQRIDGLLQGFSKSPSTCKMPRSPG